MILRNNLLPIRIGDREYPTSEHYILSSLLKDRLHKDMLLSYPADKIQDIFNQYDQEQYIKVVYDACNRFNEKKCRSIQHKGDKTIGSLARQMIRSHHDFLCKTSTNTPFRSVVGVEEEGNMLFGYNIMGHSLLRMRYILEGLPELTDQVSEYIFWKTHPEDAGPIKDPKTYKTVFPSKKKKQKPIPIKEEEDVADYFYEAEHADDDDDPEEPGFNPEEGVPLYSNDRVRWIATNMNSRLDDLRDVGARADFLYATETAPTDPFHISPDMELYSRTDPLSIFKIYKAAEHLVERMKNGMDIRVFLNKPVDAILWECKISPELFDPRSLDPRQRHTIYTEYWNKFMSKTIPYYHFIEKEILYPCNLAGFIRKEHAPVLNVRIGQKIKEVLFASFVYQVIERSYPNVAPELRIIVMNREMKKFTTEEYDEITDKLYHLFFQNKFHLDEEGGRRIMMLESFRLTTDEMEDALRFIPHKNIIQPSLDIQGTILDPMAEADIHIDGRVFHDLFQYIFYQLFIFYGGMKPSDAYQLLFHDGNMLNGNDPKLPGVLVGVVRDRRMAYASQCVQAQYRQYPQVQELFLYSKAMGFPGEDILEMDPLDLRLMRWVVSILPREDKMQHFERSAHLYFFIHDMVRSMGIMRSILGKRLQNKSLDLFIRCFYHKLETIAEGVRVSKPTPPEFISYMEDTKNITGASIHSLWHTLYPLIYVFQQDKFIPSKLFHETREKYPATTKEDMVRALSKIIGCLYQEKEVPNDHFYLLVQMMSGADDIPIWPDPSFELVKEMEEGEIQPLADLPVKLRKMIRKKPKKPKMEVVQYNIIHPSFETSQPLLREAFGTPTMVSRASYALAALEKEIAHPRRIVFYL